MRWRGKLAEPDAVQRVYVAPGNAGTALEPKLENVALDPMDIEGLAEFCQSARLLADGNWTRGTPGGRRLSTIFSEQGSALLRPQRRRRSA